MSPRGPEPGDDAAWGLRFPSPGGCGWPCSPRLARLAAGDADLCLGLDRRSMAVADIGTLKRSIWRFPPVGCYRSPGHMPWSLTLPTCPAPEFVVQPHLATAASCIVVRTGKQAFHAGAVVIDGGAWAILGTKGAGKSTVLGRLHQMGFSILTDEYLFVTVPSRRRPSMCRPVLGASSGAPSRDRSGLRRRRPSGALEGAFRRAELALPLHGWIQL